MKQPCRKILIADDHVDTLEVTQAYLSFNDYRVFAASDGRKALEMAFKVRPDSIILDVALPEMNGFDVAAALRQSDKFRDTLIVGYSGHAHWKYCDRARTSGMDFYLLKPADPAVLLACLEPEKYRNVIAKSVALIAASRELQKANAAIIAQCHAVSLRCQEAVLRAQELCETSRARIEREGRNEP